jgi:hypothetical protein
MALTSIIFKSELEILDPVTKIAYGWSYVSKKGSGVVVDHSGQEWDIAEVEKTAHEFVCDCRVGGESHVTKGGAELVESIVFSRELQDALGIDIKKDGASVEGWFTGFRITDPALLAKVESGELSMLSIGGTGIIEEVQ